MIDVDSYLLFVAAAVVLVLVPAPDMAYMLGRTIAQGRKAGVMAALGINAGAYVHVVAVVFGLSACHPHDRAMARQNSSRRCSPKMPSENILKALRA